MSQLNPFQILTAVFHCLDHSKDYPNVLMLFVPYNFKDHPSSAVHIHLFTMLAATLRTQMLPP